MLHYFFTIVLLVFIPSMVHAQVIPPDKIEEVDKDYQRREQERLEYERLQKQQFLERGTKEVETPKILEKESSLGMIEGVVCFELDKIVIEGADELPRGKKEEILKPYYRKCLKSAEINDIVTGITNWYINRGFITTRVYIPQQNIKTGTLILKVIEGRVERVIQNSDRTFDRMEVYTAFPMSKNKKLHIRDLEQGVDQLNRLPSNDAQTKIVPGEQVGYSVIEVENKQFDSFRGYLDINNGLNAEGQPKFNVRVEKDNLFHLGDQIQYNYGTGLAQSVEQIDRNQNLSLSMPFGYWTIRPSYSYYRSLTTLTISDVDYPYASYTNNYNLYADYVLYRWKAATLTLTGGLIYKNKNTYFADTILDALSRRTGNFDFGVGFTNRYSAGFYDLKLSVVQGTKLFGAKRDDPTETGLEYPKSQFRKYLVDGSWCHYFGIGLKYCANGRAQISEDTLYSEEQIGVGDRYTVRGFNKGFFLGDDGIYIRNELSLPFPYRGQNSFIRNIWSPEVFVGLDLGYAGKKGGASLYGDQGHATLGGFAFGVRNNAKFLSIGLTAGVPLLEPDFIKDIEGKNIEIYADLTVRVF